MQLYMNEYENKTNRTRWSRERKYNQIGLLVSDEVLTLN
jgi:hypothetical protein